MPGVSYFLRPGSERGGHRSGEAIPALRLFPKALAARSRQLVKLGAAIVVRCAPACFQQSLADQAEQCRIKRSLLDEQRAVGNLADPEQNAVAVEWAEGNGFQDEKIQGPGKKLSLIGHAPS